MPGQTDGEEFQEECSGSFQEFKVDSEGMAPGWDGWWSLCQCMCALKQRPFGWHVSQPELFGKVKTLDGIYEKVKLK